MRLTTLAITPFDLVQINQTEGVDGEVEEDLGSAIDAPIIEATDAFLGIKYANYIIFVAAFFSLLWAFINYKLIQKIDMKHESI